MPLPKVQMVEPVGKMARRLRKPRTNFAVSQQPFEIRPFFIHPVLPGETMKYLSVQMTAQSGLLWPTMTGAWFELYFFYVKHRDLAERDILTDMHVKNSSTAALTAAADPNYFHSVGINWQELCLKRVVEEYFRNEGEAWDSAVSASGLPLASVANDDWLDSAARTAAISDETATVPEEVMLDWMVEHNVPPGFEEHYAHWLEMRRTGLVAADFEDYLRSNGIRVPKEDTNPHRPELIRYVRDFKKPRATPAPLGEQASSYRWELSERADKDRLFKEPGFLFGVSVMRPKTYRAQKGSITGLMNDAFAWMPALLMDNPETSLRELPPAAVGALFDISGTMPESVVDFRDLLLRGEDYRAGFDGNQAYAAMGGGGPFLETLDRRFVPSDWSDGYWFETFSTAPPETFDPPVKAVLSEGVVSVQIATRIPADLTPGNNFNPGLS